MAKLLLTNIGNRNILYKGKSYSQLSQNSLIEKNKTFRQWSFELLENFENEKSHIKLNILPPLLEKLKDQFDTLVLFFSNQESNNDQDTIYEAEIIKRLFLQVGKSFEVITTEIKGSVVDNNSLIRFYRNQLNYLNYRFKYPFYFICDAGGTAQCKSALKISAEFVLEQKKFKVYYVNPDKTIQEVDTDEYRTIINKEQAITLIQRSEYLAAINILGYSLAEASESRSVVLKLLSYLYFRKNGFHDKVSSHLHRFKSNEIERNDVLKLNKTGELLSENQILIDFFGDDFFGKLVEQLYHVILYRSLENYTDMILKLSVFYENFLAMFIEKEHGYNLYSNYYWESKSFVNACNNGFFKIDWEKSPLVGEEEIRSASVPVMMEVMRKSLFEPIKSIFHMLIGFFPKQNDKRINSLRNRIAHDGFYVDAETIHKSTPDDFFQILDELIEFFELKYVNIYTELNEYVISSLRSS